MDCQEVPHSSGMTKFREVIQPPAAAEIEERFLQIAAPADERIQKSGPIPSAWGAAKARRPQGPVLPFT